MLIKEPEMLQPDTFLQAYNAAKWDCGQGFAPNPAGGAYSTPPDPLAAFNGPVWGGERGRGMEERRERGKERGNGRGEIETELLIG